MNEVPDRRSDGSLERRDDARASSSAPEGVEPLELRGPESEVGDGDALRLLESMCDALEEHSGSLEQISTRTMDVIANFVAARFGSLYLAHPAGYYQLYASQGDRELPPLLVFPEQAILAPPPRVDILEPEHPIVPLDAKASLMVRVATLGESLFIPDVDAFRRSERLETPEHARSMGESCIILPLTSGNHLYGVLNLASLDSPISADSITDEAVRRGLRLAARWVARQLAQTITLLNVQARARRDGLTGLYNYSTFYEVLDREVLRARRYEGPLSLILIDLDAFKSINDEFGHLAGDQILRDFALRVRGALRAIDIPARYAGDEFAVILPETSIDGAQQVAQRIHHDVSSRPFHFGEVEVTVTVSVGVAELGSLPSSVDLVAKADQLLYRAKAAGRNRVEG